MAEIGLDGGAPVRGTRSTRRGRRWTRWPIVNEETWPIQRDIFGEIYLSGTEGLPGPRAKRFADSYNAYLGTSHGLMTTSGSTALKLAFCAVTGTDGLGYNGEVIVPNYTFIASAHTAWEMGFSVRFVDVEPETGCMDPDALEAAIGPNTRVVLPVDILGYPADMDRILAVARKHNLKVIDDACQAHGAVYKGKKVGTMADAGCFSFQSTKNLTCGEGGFLATNSVEVYNHAHALHDVGRAPDGVTPDQPYIGYNYRPSEYLASLLENRLKQLDAECELRNRGARYLTKELEGITGIRPAQPLTDAVTNHAWHLYSMRYTPSAFGNRSRDDFIRALRAEGIPCMAGYTYLQSQHSISQAVKTRHPELIAEEPSPNAEALCAESVWLYQWMLLADEDDLADVPEAIRRIQKAFHA